MAKSATATAAVIHNDALAPNHKWVLKCNTQLDGFAFVEVSTK